MNTDEILEHLKEQRNRINTAILALEGKLSTQETHGNGAVHVGTAKTQHKNNLIDFAHADLTKVKNAARVKVQFKPRVRHMTRAARMRISQAQKLRWARQRRQVA